MTYLKEVNFTNFEKLSNEMYVNEVFMFLIVVESRYTSNTLEFF
jgi:hypothetical protein